MLLIKLLSLMTHWVGFLYSTGRFKVTSPRDSCHTSKTVFGKSMICSCFLMQKSKIPHYIFLKVFLNLLSDIRIRDITNKSVIIILLVLIYNNTAFSFVQQHENRGQDGIRYFYSNGGLKINFTAC